MVNRLAGLLLVFVTGCAGADDSATPLGDPVLEAPTLHSLGAYWIISGDDDGNAKVSVEYRETGEAQWRAGADLFRVEKGANEGGEHGSQLDVPEDASLFAGSIVMLEPDTEYELRLTLADPGGGEGQKTLTARTRAEPVIPEGMRMRFVTPGNGGGTGTKDDPFRGLEAADAAAQPGDWLVVREGIYEGTFIATQSGTPEAPIVWMAEGKPVIDGQGEGRGISAGDIHDVWFEGLRIRNADYGIVAHRSSRIVIRRCRISDVEYGITCTNNSNDAVRGFFISDNTIEGPSTWPRTQGIENARGIQVTGTGHDICYNRIRGFADAVDTFGSQRCEAIDIHHNEISEMTDDGIEMDYSERNTRCFLNRLTNVFQGISVQPIFGGPVYIFRNAMHNVVGEPFKMHNSPSGALMLHNTSVKAGMPLVLWTNEPVRNCVFRNNLFIGTTGNYAYESTAPMVDCDFDYDGFGGGPWELFLKWNGERYGTIDDARDSAPVYGHAVEVGIDSVFASGVEAPADAELRYELGDNDLRLAEGTAAIDAGIALPGFNDGFGGEAPDLGAFELGDELPHYGPR